MTNPHTFNIIPFSTKLAVMRTARGLNQAELARELGIDPALISRYENGLKPSSEQIKNLEKFFGADFNHPEIEQAIRTLSGARELAVLAA